MNFMRLRYVRDDDWSGELTASIQSNGFAGCGSAWFSHSQIDDFLAQLEPCPIPDGDGPTLAGGYFNKDGSFLKKLLGIRIVAHNKTGVLRICVHLTSDSAFGGEENQTLNAVLLATYADIASFKSALAAHLAGKTDEAELIGRP